jgi:hypothetical protein
MTASALISARELHSRINDAIHVRLLWCEPDGRPSVAANDSKGGGEFCVEVRDRERAPNVFHHPYAYAAYLGIDPGAVAADATAAIALRV